MPFQTYANVFKYMKNKLIYFLLFITLPLFSQRAEDGEHFFNSGQYTKAKEEYAALLKKKPKDKLLNYRYARCCYELNEVDEAIKHFQLAGENFYSSGFYLGELYTCHYEFEKAIKAYDAYLKILKEDNKNIPSTQRKIAQCELAEKYLSRVEDIAIVDSIVVDKTDFLRFYALNAELGGLKQESIVFDSLKAADKITYNTQRNDRVYFSDSINGKMNLFTSYRLLNKWSEPSLLPKSVNFENSNNNYPFLLLDGVTLYFGSDSENSIGGYDIFITKYVPSGDTYLTPENIGMPFNSPYNDYMMVIDEINKIGWFATDRYQPADKVVIYTFLPNEIKSILRSDDKDLLRQSAQLKTYRKGEMPEIDFVKTEVKIDKKEKDFEFAIYDQVVYTSKSHFKSKDALVKFEDFYKEYQRNESRKEQLKSLRDKYAVSSVDEQTDLASKIIELEDFIRKGEERAAELRIEVCNEEIKHLKQVQNQ